MTTPSTWREPPTRVAGRPTRDGGQSPVARRILDVAAARFYGQGIRAVSADTLIADAGVTKATFYRHFPTKDDLVVAYLDAVIDAEQSMLARWRGEHPEDPAAVLGLYLDALTADACGPSFRGCPFINAAAEYPDAAHPVRAAVARHRAWLLEQTTALARAMGVEDPETAGAQLVLLRDGFLVASEAGAQPAAGEALRRAAAALLGLEL